MDTKILIADDDGSVRRMVARVLETAGYTAIQTATWRETVISCRTLRPSLVLLDLEMLPAAGWTVLRVIRRGSNPVPVIGFTAWADQHDTAIRWAVDVLMDKPLDLGFLLHTIKELHTGNISPGPKLSLRESEPLVDANERGPGGG
jgi:DNA-binding response OmpR family regulator